MHKSLQYLKHRPWELPSEKWQWRQSWLDVGFIHFRVNRTTIRNLIPHELLLDEFDGTPWISIVPFCMHDVMKGSLPSFGSFKSFLELNLRTYVKHNNKPGVWFFSLDAASLPVVLGGRWIYGIPYFYSHITSHKSKGLIHFHSKRSRSNVLFDALLKPFGDEFYAEKGSFEHWITERYCLYSKPWYGKISRVEVHHKQWPLHMAEVDIKKNDLYTSIGGEHLNEKPLAHFSSGVDVISYGGRSIDK